MNPPSALYGAMNRDRKPFTYTPGGLDLSEIKSERMAQRLMRNAMNQGVPEQPTSHLQSPPTPSTLNVPNFNCLPVQVFPTFPLPANPKSLLKTRSNQNQQKDPCREDIPYPEHSTHNFKQLDSKQSIENNNKKSFSYIQASNENKNDDQCLPLYEFNAPIVRSYPSSEKNECSEQIFSKIDTNTVKDINSQADNQIVYESRHINIEDTKPSFAADSTMKIGTDVAKQIVSNSKYIKGDSSLRSSEEIMGTENDQKEVKVVKKQQGSENNMEEQNGDTNVEAAVTVKLPGKKSAAKTETKVEVVKKVLPDGSTEEVKTTTTKNTIDGKTEITTKTETTIIPKEDDLEEEELVEEEEEEEVEEEEQQQENNYNAVVQEENEIIDKLTENTKKIIDEKEPEPEDNSQQESNQTISKQEETLESSVTKNITIIQSTDSQVNSDDEVEDEEENEKEIITKTKNEQDDQFDKTVTDINVESEVDVEEDADIGNKNKVNQQPEQEDKPLNINLLKTEQESEEEKEELEESVEEPELISNVSKKQEEQKEEGELLEDSEKVDRTCQNEPQESNDTTSKESSREATQSVQENKEEIIIEVQVVKPDMPTTEESKTIQSPAIKENEPSLILQTERNIPLREPSVPLEKVEDVEIKPIGQIISKSHTENTEIITTSIDKPSTGLSTQTAYNRIENIVTVNRTTKTLDHAYEQFAPLGIPTVKTYFVPNTERLSTSPQPSRPYQPVYPPEPQSERRHSLLLDRLSVDPQMPPAELYQNNYQSNQTYEQNQWTQEPQSEVLTVSNVKPSTITKNQQWYQQTKKEEVSYNNNTAPSFNVPSKQWNPQQSQPQQLLPQSQLQPQYQPQPQFQQSYIDKQDTFRATSNNSSTYQQSTYPSYQPKPTNWVGNNMNSTKTPPSMNKQVSQFSYVENTSENYHKPDQQFSSYIPPPWEQNSNYVTEDINQTYYAPPPSNQFENSATPSWTPMPTTKFSKPKPTSYIPPAPNQSFVKQVSAVDPPRLPGRKTYYSEYERRYISVPESTYIPTENKFQAQPDPSPQYYYDNNEPSENVEHEWRKELREFSEKTQSQSQSDQTSVKPPWEEDPKYYVPKVKTEYTPTPTWSQTLRPSSWRERSFESEFVRSKELPRTNTLGRGRPQSSYVKSNISQPIPDRSRGVSVDRYNPNNYKSPVSSEYPPVQSHTLDPSIGAKTYHNPNVPAYHSRASAEPSEHSTAFPQPRRVEARAPPVQSRSFKYLQWITGTED